MKKRFEKFIEKHREKHMGSNLRDLSGMRSFEQDVS